MPAPLIITRLIKAGTLQSPTGEVPAYLYPKSITVTKKVTSVITPIPGEQHLPIPIGPEAKEIAVNAPWNLNNNPCANKSYTESLKNWTCNSIYQVQVDGSLVSEDIDGYYLAKTISTARDAKTGTASGLGRWDLSIQLIKLRDEDITDCPDFTDITESATPSTGDAPFLIMTRVGTESQTITRPLTSLKVSHQGAVQSFPLYDEEAITILPPLGNTGPVVDVSFTVTNTVEYDLIQTWAATRNLVVQTTQCKYPEIDNDGGGYHSKWIVTNVSIQRASASALDPTHVFRNVSMSLTRYWRYAQLELGG
jgi:hypothetical protein